MKQNKSYAAFLIIATVFLAITFTPLFANERTLDAFGREDGIFESLTAVYLFATSVLFAVGFFRLRKSSWLLKLSYAGLALIFFLGAGEEISWGERIFNLDDHNYIRGINVQGELTIHNLKYFQGDDAIIPVSASQIFTAFAFVFALIIPLVCRLSPKVAGFIAPLFPIMPLPPGILVAVTYIFQKAMLRLLPVLPGLYKHPSMPIPQGVHEMREHGYAFALLASTIFYFSRIWAAKTAEAGREAQGDLANPGSILAVGMDNKGDKI